jgi:DNA polymerase I-like protein with 3'-5' exonuclease and polymerase domains
MNNTIHAISHMHQHGSYIDTDYLSKLADKRKSPLIGEIQEIEKRIQSSEVVTSFLLKSSTKPGSKSGQAGGLFASVGKSDTAFDINKPANKKAIFFGEDYLNLTPINVSKITKEPAVDKLLFSTYKHTVPLAADYADWTILNKFLSTYVNAWNESLQDDLDGSKDGCLRPSFGFFNVVTGRLNSFKPSLHQIPSRASTAKKIKKAFIAKPGMLQVKWDFSAHEVRMWGNEAYDPGIGELFRIGQRLRQEFIVTMDPEKKALLMKEMKTKGDVHVANVARFFGVWVSKDDPLRDAVKAVIFG